MKNIIAIVVFALLGVISAHAQTDTIRDERKQVPDTVPAPAKAQEQDVGSDWVLIQDDKIPDELRKSLLQEQYAGWETAGVFRHKETGEFTVEIKTAGGSKKYRFDNKGQPLTGLGSEPVMNPNQSQS